MNLKYLMLLPILFVGFIACGEDDDPPTSNNNTANNNAANNNMTANNNAASLQQQASDNGQVEFIDGNGLMIRNTLAIDLSGTSLPAPSAGLPASLDTADYYGAVDPTATIGWWQAWAYRNAVVDGNLPGNGDFHPLEAEIMNGIITAAAASNCATLGYGDGGTVDIFGEVFPVCIVSSAITTSIVWPNDHVFLLDGTINVGTGDAALMGGAPVSNATLTIQPGTQIFAVEGSATSLVITRGSDLIADGTVDEPIIFGAVAADPSVNPAIVGNVTDLTGRGLWGGIVLSGFGMNNDAEANSELRTEAIATGQDRYFGGTDNLDGSGILRYVIIAEAGVEVRGRNRMQGLTLEAAGSNTTIEYLQVIGAEDDCLEWFGGAAPAKWVVCQGQGDDGLEMSEGYQGDVQFVLVSMGRTNGDQGLVVRNNSDFEATPATAPNIANLTILGAAGQAGQSQAALHSQGSRGTVYRSVYTDHVLNGTAFGSGCLDIDDVLPPTLAYRDGIFNCSPGPLAEADD